MLPAYAGAWRLRSDINFNKNKIYFKEINLQGKKQFYSHTIRKPSCSCCVIAYKEPEGNSCDLFKPTICRTSITRCQTWWPASAVWWSEPWSVQCCLLHYPACSGAKLHCRCVSKRLGIGANWSGEAWTGKAGHSNRAWIAHIEDSRRYLNVSSFLTLLKSINMLLP
jgi:hypothetical protein